MKKPVLVVMAAGMGSRYGGLKQMDPVDGQGHIIMDYSIYDAKRAGFEKVVFVIKREIEEGFKNTVGNRISKHMETVYVFQDPTNLPDGYAVPEGRVKPWGTAHAVYSCLDVLDGPFAVINADDYYGAEAFRLVYDHLAAHEDDEKYRYVMVSYLLGNTLTEHGYVSRGICEVNGRGELTGITERVHIEKKKDGIAFTEDGGATWTYVPEQKPVSMNMWGFTESILVEIAKGFPGFLEQGLGENPMTCEYYLPAVVSRLLDEGRASVKVLASGDKWYGITYKEDKETVAEAIQGMKDRGMYPQELWES